MILEYLSIYYRALVWSYVNSRNFLHRFRYKRDKETTQPIALTGRDGHSIIDSLKDCVDPSLIALSFQTIKGLSKSQIANQVECRPIVPGYQILRLCGNLTQALNKEVLVPPGFGMLFFQSPSGKSMDKRLRKRLWLAPPPLIIFGGWP